jgi:hypothetical protein
MPPSEFSQSLELRVGFGVAVCAVAMTLFLVGFFLLVFAKIAVL